MPKPTSKRNKKKTTQLLKKRKLNAENFTQLIYKIELTSYETPASSLEKSKTSTSLQTPTESVVASQEDHAQTRADQRNLNANNTHKNLDEEKSLKTNQTAFDTTDRLIFEDLQPAANSVDHSAGLLDINCSIEAKEKDSNTNSVVTIKPTEGIISTDLINLVFNPFKNSNRLTDCVEFFTACFTYIFSLFGSKKDDQLETKQSVQSKENTAAANSFITTVGLFSSKQAEDPLSNVTQCVTENEKSMTKS